MNAESELLALADAIAQYDAYCSEAHKDDGKREGSPTDAGDYYLALAELVRAVETLLRVGLNPGESFLRFFHAAAKQLPPTPEIHPLVCAMFDTQDATLLHMPIVERERLYLVMSLGLPGSLMRTAQRCFRLTTVVSQFYHVESSFCNEKFLDGALQPMLKRLARLKVKAASDVEEGIRLMRRCDLAEEARAEQANVSPSRPSASIHGVAVLGEENRTAEAQAHSALPIGHSSDASAQVAVQPTAAHTSGPPPPPSDRANGGGEAASVVATAKSTAIVIKKKRRSKPLPQDVSRQLIELPTSVAMENLAEPPADVSTSLDARPSAALTERRTDAATQTVPLANRVSAFAQTSLTAERHDIESVATTTVVASLVAWEEKLRIQEASLARLEAALKEKEMYLAKKEQLALCFVPTVGLETTATTPERDTLRCSSGGGVVEGNRAAAKAAGTVVASPQLVRHRSLSMAIRASLEREGGGRSSVGLDLQRQVIVHDGSTIPSPTTARVSTPSQSNSNVVARADGATEGNGSPNVLASSEPVATSLSSLVNGVREASAGRQRSITTSVDLAAGTTDGALWASNEELVVRAQLAAEAQGWVCYSCSMPLDVRRAGANPAAAGTEPSVGRFANGIAQIAERLPKLAVPRSSKGSMSQRAEEASDSGHHLSASNSDGSSASKGASSSLRWCHLSDAVYCESCLPSSSRWYVDTYVCRDWNVTMYPVSSAMRKARMQSFTTPTISPEDMSDAVLQSPVVQAARGLRQQLRILTSMVRNCEQRGSLLDDIVNSRYCALEESYSLADLVMLSSSRSSCPVSAVASVSLLDRLKEMRDSLVIHCARACQRCKARSSKSCSLCSDRKPIFLFDTQHTSTCSHCNAAYHTECWSAAGGSCGKCKESGEGTS